MSIYLVSAYCVFWAFTFVFVLSIWSRQRRIGRSLEAFKERLDKIRAEGD